MPENTSAASFASRLTQAWLGRGLLARLLWPLSLLFGLLAAARRAMYALHLRRAARLPVPVIVVGNIFVGGTGKTPLTIWLVQALRQAGYTPGVISRGYGSRAGTQTPRAVIIGGDPALFGDEPLLIAEQANCPVMVGRRRVAAGRALLQVHPEIDVVISDDGLQHYALARDIEIVLSDSRGVGNGWLLPAGPLREPVGRRRDFTVVNLSGGPDGAAGADEIGMRIVGEDAWQLRDPACRRALRDFTEYVDADGQAWRTRIAAAAGMGNPARFFNTLRQAGLQFAELPLPDHYHFSQNPFAALDADAILITAKDAVKCRAIESIRNDQRIWVVPVTAQLDGPLAEHIVEKLRERPTA